MKKICMYLLIFSLLCAISNFGIDYTVGQHLQNQSPYYLSFASIGANSLESELDGWAKIKTTSSKKELESYLINILQSLHLPTEPNNFLVEGSKNKTILKYEVIFENNIFKFILESDEVIKETYFIINIEAKEITDYKSYVRKLNGIIGLNWVYYYQYKGFLDLAVNEEGAQKIIAVMMKNLQAEHIQMFKDHKTCSGTGYSKSLAKTVPNKKVEKNYVNVQIAVQVDEVKKRTNILIGSPLIIGEY